MGIIDTRIINKESFKVVGMEIDWKPDDVKPSENPIAQLWEEFNKRLCEIPHANRAKLYGLERFKPNGKPDDPLTYLASVEVSTVESELPEGMVAADVPPSTYAVVTYKGVIDGIGLAYDHFYTNWGFTLEEYKPANTFSFEYYDVRFKGNDNSESILEVWFPLHKKMKDLQTNS